MTAAELKMIAIVDDDDAGRHALEFLLRVQGRRPESFASASAFLDSEIGKFACLILDHHMPAMTGLELAQRLRAEAFVIPIMLISGDLSADIVEKAAQLGIDRVSEKPPEMAELSAFIERALQ